MDPEAILAGLNDEQREAATATTGPVVILAGAGTGKTRVISHRVAYAAATGAIDPKQALVVTFTEKAAAEMRHASCALGLPQVQASTFHAAARRQLAHYWPIVHGPTAARGARLEAADHRVRWLAACRAATVHAGEGPGRRDRVGQGPPPDASTYAPEREPPVPRDVFISLWRRYEPAKGSARTGSTSRTC